MEASTLDGKTGEIPYLKWSVANCLTHRYSKILMTGGAGFIGSHIVDGLPSESFEVIAIDDLYTGRLENLANHQDMLVTGFGILGYGTNKGEVKQDKRAMQGARLLGKQIVQLIKSIKSQE